MGMTKLKTHGPIWSKIINIKTKWQLNYHTWNLAITSIQPWNKCTNKFTNKLLGPNQNKKQNKKIEISINKKCTLVWTGWVWISLWLLNPGLWIFQLFLSALKFPTTLYENKRSILVTDDEGSLSTRSSL